MNTATNTLNRLNTKESLKNENNIIVDFLNSNKNLPKEIITILEDRLIVINKLYYKL